MTRRGKETPHRQTQGRGGASARSMAKILSAAMDIANREGLRGLTIGVLARTVGMSKSGVFARFNSKDKLQLTVLEIAAQDFAQQVVEPALRQEKGLRRMQILFEGWLGYLNEDSQQGWLLLRAAREVDTYSEEVQDYARGVQRNLLGTLERVIKGACEVGELDHEADVKGMARQWYWGMLGYFHFKFILKDQGAEDHLRQFFDQLVEMSKSRRSSSRAA